MKIDRLIGIITVLQKKKKVTAPYLAARFEVSRRTILRDIETICAAGIPIVTEQGTGGGISLAEGFSLDTAVFTESELAAIFTGLKTLDSVSFSPRAARLAEKFGGEHAVSLAQGMVIDLSSFYKDDLAAKIERIQSAIREKRCISFHYYYHKGEADKTVEPYLVVFKWSDWYVFGFCRERQDFRMYKLRRLWQLCVIDDVYTEREIPPQKKQFGSYMTDDYVVTALFEPSVKYRLVEEYGPDSFTELDDGMLRAQRGFTDVEEAVRWYLGFGTAVRVLEPPEFVKKMKKAAETICGFYQT